MIDLSKLGIDINSIVFYLVNYGLVFLIVYHFFGKTLNNYLKSRQDSISNNINESELIKQEMKDLREKYEKEKETAIRNIEDKVKHSELALRTRSEEVEKYLESYKKELIKKTDLEIKELKQKALLDVKNDVTNFISLIIIDYLKENVKKEEVENSVSKSFDKFLKSYE